jgi:hypothetical protein
MFSDNNAAFFCVCTDFHFVREVSITNRTVRFLFIPTPVKGSQHKSVVHKLYVLSTLSNFSGFQELCTLSRNRKSKLKGFVL